MIPFRLTALACVAALAFAARADADERSALPAPGGSAKSWTALGPFLFSQALAPAGRVSGFRPFYVERKAGDGGIAEATVLYPLFYYRAYGPNYEWSVFKLINHFGRKDGESVRPATEEEDFDVWPFYFSGVTPDKKTSYRALFPIGGTLMHRFSRDRISFVLWPLYLQTEKAGAVTTSTPWPIFHTTRGAAQGFALWPLYGREDRPGFYHREYYLWPLAWNNTILPAPDAPPGTSPVRQSGFLPFYTSDRGPDAVSENFLWPFFGYTDRTAPFRDHVTRYFWPFFVQGRGEEHFINRWGPFYTHSIIKGYDKTWVIWPLWRRAHWTAEGVAQTKTQFYYFIYWGLEQRSLSNPNAAPARKIHIWPLLSYWDNGAGRRQWQAISPLEVFFPHNDDVRQAWTPLFSIFKYDQQAPGETRWSFLWDGVTWKRSVAENRSEFHLGPLFGIQNAPGERRITLLGGVVGLHRRPADAGWRVFGMDFSGNQPTVASRSR